MFLAWCFLLAAIAHGLRKTYFFDINKTPHAVGLYLQYLVLATLRKPTVNRHNGINDGPDEGVIIPHPLDRCDPDPCDETTDFCEEQNFFGGGTSAYIILMQAVQHSHCSSCHVNCCCRKYHPQLEALSKLLHTDIPLIPCRIHSDVRPGEIATMLEENEITILQET